MPVRCFPVIKAGDKIKYVYLKHPNPLGEKVIGFKRRMPDKEDLRQYVDYQTQFQKVFLQPIRNTTDTIRIPLQTYREVDINALF